MNNNIRGHIAAFFTVMVWGTTFVTTKLLLAHFSPIEILFFRFSIGFIALSLAYPHFLKVKDSKHHILFICAGLTGVTLYFLFENIALNYTSVINVGILASSAPLFTGIFAGLFLKERFTLNFFIGFLIAMTGITLIMVNGVTVLKISPKGDILAVSAAIMWGIYSIFIRKLSAHYHSVQLTRRVFFWGILFMLPVMYFMNFRLGLDRFSDSSNIFRMMFLGFGASALCFATWSFATKVLGVIHSSVYIYLVPAITMLSSVIVLHEKITTNTLLGAVLTITGLLVSEGVFAKLFKQSKVKKQN